MRCSKVLLSPYLSMSEIDGLAGNMFARFFCLQKTASDL